MEIDTALNVRTQEIVLNLIIELKMNNNKAHYSYVLSCKFITKGKTARIISNAILMNQHHFPISFRTVDSVEYKKAMLIFYEQNNISAFKKFFISQFEFAVKTYF